MDNRYNNWKKPKEENFHGGFRPRSSHNSRGPPFGNGWQQSALSLEKKFCATVGGVSWQKVLETKKYMYQDEKILQWKDSAVQEAFWNAKKRFWAQMHGQPCDIELPDPDIFIDKIDWDSDVDPKLISGLEEETDISPENEEDGGVVGIPVVPEQYVFTPTGWGDAEEGDLQLKNPERREEKGVNEEARDWSKGLENDYPYTTRNMRGNRDSRSSWNRGYRNNNMWDHGYKKKWDHGGRNTSRYNIARYQHYGNEQSLVDGYGSKNGNFSCGRPMVKWKPVTRQY